jgi:hypothetical protein
VIENSTSLVLEEIALDQLKPHPRNYRSHPEDEIEHLVESIHANGIYRNIVIASEGTILAGRGVAIAARRAGYSTAPVYRAPFGPDDPRALKLLIADNEISHLAENDDRLLTELLRELKESEVGLLGTGYDDMMLANLVFVTRPASEIADLDAAAQWVGMPEYDLEDKQARLSIIVNFASEEDRQAFCQRLGLDVDTISVIGTSKSIWWPKRAKKDVHTIRFTDRTREEDSNE